MDFLLLFSSFGIVFLLIEAFLFGGMIYLIHNEETSARYGKWVVLALAAGLVVLFYSAEVKQNLDFILSATFGMYILSYLGIGIGYSISELVLAKFSYERKYSAAWQKFLSSRIEFKVKDPGDEKFICKKMTVKEALAIGNDRTKETYVDDLCYFLESFIGNNVGSDAIVSLTCEKDGTIKPYMNRANVLKAVADWIVLWPLYAVDLVIGRVVVEIANAISTVFISVDKRFMQYVFSDTFKS